MIISVFLAITDLPDVSVVQTGAFNVIPETTFVSKDLNDVIELLYQSVRIQFVSYPKSSEQIQDQRVP